MKNNFVSNITAPIYILFAERNKEYIQKITIYAIIVLLYMTEIVTGDIHRSYNHIFILNMIISIVFIKTVSNIMTNIGAPSIGRMYVCVFLYIALFGEIMFTRNTSEIIHQGKISDNFTLISYYILSHTIDPVMIAIMGAAIYKDTTTIMHENKPSLSYHAATQKIRTFPHFVKQYALEYYTNTNH